MGVGLERKAADKGSLEKGHKSGESLEVGCTGSIRRLGMGPCGGAHGWQLQGKMVPTLKQPKPYL